MMDYQPIADLLLFPFLLAAITGWGAVIWRCLAWDGPGRIERFCLQYALGLGVCAGMWFALSVAGQIHAAAALAMAGVGWVFAIRRIAPLRRSCSATRLVFARLPPPRVVVTEQMAPRLLRVGALAVLLFQFMGALTPETGHDALAYHLYTPRVFIWNHGRTAMPYNYQSHMPLNAQMIYLWSLLVGGEVLAKLMCWSQLAALTGLIGALMGRHFGRGAGSMAAFTMVTALSAAYQHAPLSCGSDIMVGLFFAAALSAMLQCVPAAALKIGGDAALAAGHEWRALAGCGVFCGFALGAKYTAIPFVLLPLGGTVVLTALSRTIMPGESLATRLAWASRRGFAVAAIAFALMAPWLIRAWIETGHPLYPAFPQAFRIKPAYIAGAWMIETWMRTTEEQTVLWAAADGDLLLPMFPVCGVICLALRESRARSLGWASLLAHLSLLALPALGQWPRLFSVTMPSSAAVCAVTLTRAPIRAATRQVLAALIAAGLAGAFVNKQWTFMRAETERWDGRPKWSRAAAEAHVRDKGPFNDGRLDLYEYIERALPPSARLLFHGVKFAFHCPRSCAAAGEWNEDYLDTLARVEGGAAERLLGALRREGFTHIIASIHEPDDETPLARIRPHLRPMASFGRFLLYEIAPTHSDSARSIPPQSASGFPVEPPGVATLR